MIFTLCTVKNKCICPGGAAAATVRVRLPYQKIRSAHENMYRALCNFQLEQILRFFFQLDFSIGMKVKLNWTEFKVNLT